MAHLSFITHELCMCMIHLLRHILKHIFPAFPALGLIDFTESNRLPMFPRPWCFGPSVAENQPVGHNWMWHYDCQELSTPCHPMDWPNVIVLAQCNSQWDLTSVRWFISVELEAHAGGTSKGFKPITPLDHGWLHKDSHGYCLTMRQIMQQQLWLQCAVLY